MVKTGSTSYNIENITIEISHANTYCGMTTVWCRKYFHPFNKLSLTCVFFPATKYFTLWYCSRSNRSPLKGKKRISQNLEKWNPPKSCIAKYYKMLCVYDDVCVCGDPCSSFYHPLVLKQTSPQVYFGAGPHVLTWDTRPKHLWGSNVWMWGMEQVQGVLGRGHGLE